MTVDTEATEDLRPVMLDEPMVAVPATLDHSTMDNAGLSTDQVSQFGPLPVNRHRDASRSQGDRPRRSSGDEFRRIYYIILLLFNFIFHIT